MQAISRPRRCGTAHPPEGLDRSAYSCGVMGPKAIARRIQFLDRLGDQIGAVMDQDPAGERIGFDALDALFTAEHQF